MGKVLVLYDSGRYLRELNPAKWWATFDPSSAIASRSTWDRGLK
jgi:hypothetical protein